MRIIVVPLLVFSVPAIAETAGPAGNVTEERVLAESGQGDDWLLNGGNFRGEHFSTLTDINDGNVQGLGLAWSFDLPAPDGISATPIVVDGTIYLSAPRSVVFAIDASSGRMRWIYDPGLKEKFAAEPSLSWRSRVNRGVAVWSGKVYVGTADCRLIALDAATGEEVWTTTTCDPGNGYGISDAPRVGGGKVFLGNAGSESEEKNRGYVSAYAADDGRLLWRFFTVPSDDPAQNTTPALRMAAATWSGDALKKFGGGGSAWNEMTYDPTSDLLYFGTAGALPYIHKFRNPEGGDNLFTSCVMAINATTGKYVWHYQTVPQDSWDYNATMNIVLADFESGGATRKVAMIAPKNGFFYVLDRVSGALISAQKYAKVNWANHINMETGRPELDPEGMYWNLPAGESVAVWPNMWGAHSTQPMAYHPGLKLVYIPVIDAPQIVTMLEDGDFKDTMELIDEVDGKPHSPGKLLAWDPQSQAPRWVVEHELPVNGGVLATAGNLVFQGNAMGEFVAYDAASGDGLWSASTGTAISAAPVTYRAGDDQYVLIAAGVGGIMQFFYPKLHAGPEVKGPTRLFAFKLNGDRRMPQVPVDSRRVGNLPRLEADADTLRQGAALYEEHCSGCHGKDAVARYGGTAPDLRYSVAELNKTWHAIVIGGAKRGDGMPPFPITTRDSEAIKAFVVSEARKLVDD